MKNSFIYTVIFTFLLCFFFVLILSFTDGLTKETIAANREFVRQQAILISLGVQESGVDTKEKVSDIFSQVEEVQRGENTYYKANFVGTPSYAKSFAGPGLWGTISGYIAISDDLSQTVGFEIVDQNETPGLGARISEPWFKEQFRGEKLVNGNITVAKSGTGDENKENGSIDGVSGATRTSDAIEAILQKEIETFNKDLGR